MKIPYNTLCILWALLILILSLIGGIQLPDYTIFNLFTFDKIIHIGMYGTLTFLLINVLRKQGKWLWLQKKSLWYAFLFAWLYGTLIECMQAFLIPNRFGDFYDTIANLVGGIFGILAFQILQNRTTLTGNK